MRDLLSKLFDTFYRQNPNFKVPEAKEDIIKGVLFILDSEFKYWSWEEKKEAITFGITGRWEHCKDFTVYNVRQWLMGYDKDFKNKVREKETYQHQRMTPEYKPTEHDRNTGSVVTLCMKYFLDTSFTAKAAPGGYKQPDLLKYIKKMSLWDKEQMKKAHTYFRLYERLEEPLGKHITKELAK